MACLMINGEPWPTNRPALRRASKEHVPYRYRPKSNNLRRRCLDPVINNTGNHALQTGRQRRCLAAEKGMTYSVICHKKLYFHFMSSSSTHYTDLIQL
ncbi:jg3105 [Pararge aegeria aegeria]|uniref:Jg3105 protein n=1 Tax=Pararge aegeria aegeria TaxID=348720 RepID=A0A8S4RDB6_9NEOP|nr:jg3105 [Pararge aegeria aegeria]